MIALLCFYNVDRVINPRVLIVKERPYEPEIDQKNDYRNDKDRSVHL